jgi:hypothetical protein
MRAVRAMVLLGVFAVIGAACAPAPTGGGGTPPAGPVEPATDVCFDPVPSFPTLLDFSYQGPINEADNATVYVSDDGSCTGSGAPVTIVTAFDEAAAQIVCDSIHVPSLTNVVALGPIYTPKPSDDTYSCVPTGGTQPVEPATGCYDVLPGILNLPDLEYVGPLNEVDNVVVHSSTSGSCLGTQYSGLAIVTASDAPAAATICDQLLGPSTHVSESLSGVTVPVISPDAYVCYPLPVPFPEL